MQSFAEDPANFIQTWLESQSRDLETILGSGPTDGLTFRQEELRRHEFFKLPWVEEVSPPYTSRVFDRVLKCFHRLLQSRKVHDWPEDCDAICHCIISVSQIIASSLYSSAFCCLSANVYGSTIGLMAHSRASTGGLSTPWASSTFTSLMEPISTCSSRDEANRPLELPSNICKS